MSLIYELSAELGRCLANQQLMLTTAESCTGGGIAAAITDVPNSSTWFSHGFVTYSNAAKQQQLHINPTLIETYGAVSQPVVEAMAAGALAVASADLAIAVSGIAGPDGGTNEKPVGTVWIAWVRPNNRPTSQMFSFSGDRKSVRNQSVIASLKGALSLVENNTV